MRASAIFLRKLPQTPKAKFRPVQSEPPKKEKPSASIVAVLYDKFFDSKYNPLRYFSNTTSGAIALMLLSTFLYNIPMKNDKQKIRERQREMRESQRKAERARQAREGEGELF
ncbi:MAG: hypothetical protein M1814_004367 [Vezdaea aestivalis]|nr:MAG: hypothetical protein M1814_004367 [Vezdaea aestivalis]